VDEVLAVGDTAFQKKSLGKMEDVARGGRTVLFVSHNMPSVINLCQRAILLDAGKVVKDGPVTEVVQHYLATARTAGGELVWPDLDQAPGDDTARLYAVRILQDSIDRPTADVDISREVIIQIEYWNLQEGALLCSSIELKTVMGTDVLASSNAHGHCLVEDPWYGRPQPPGLYQSICRIPRDFLNEGRYSVTAILAKMPGARLILRAEPLSFDVYDTGEMRKEYYGHWGGVVRPRLAWHTEYRRVLDSIFDSAAKGETMEAT
jgi:lipopolysaccharide transport system ATP-binding protein